MNISTRVLTTSASSRQIQFDVDRQPFASVVIENLEWDTKILGINCARLNHFQGPPTDRENSINPYELLVHELRQSGLAYVTARVPQREWSRIHALESVGFKLVDGILDFDKKLGDAIDVILPASYHLRIATRGDGRPVADLAVRTFTLSRFHNDPILSKAQADLIHSEWGKNCCREGETDSQVVWLAESEHGLAGFVTCKAERDSGRIGLIAVDSRDSGKGLGSALVHQASNWFRQNKCLKMSVQTQTNNLAAVHIYTKLEFKLASASVTLRWSASESGA